MDCSETYIKMCEKAVEIQGKWEPNPMGGDFVCDEPHASGRWTVTDDRWLRCVHDVWLPRQDQLQEMFPKQDSFHLDVIFFRNMILKFGSDFLSHQADSWEQVWLILVMKEKFNKVWNGTDWVNA